MSGRKFIDKLQDAPLKSSVTRDVRSVKKLAGIVPCRLLPGTATARTAPGLRHVASSGAATVGMVPAVLEVATQHSTPNQLQWSTVEEPQSSLRVQAVPWICSCRCVVDSFAAWTIHLRQRAIVSRALLAVQDCR